MTLVVLTPDGSPIVGAKVKPDGLRTIVDPGSHYWWVTKRHGPHPEQLTDKKGEVEITYPKFVGERKEAGQVTFSIDHPDFVLYWADQATSQRGIAATKLFSPPRLKDHKGKTRRQSKLFNGKPKATASSGLLNWKVSNCK